jgi:Holliday junction resolvase
MVNSRDKGARAELVARDLMRKATGLVWERTPSSGALSSNHKLKGDLYVPNEKNRYLIEVKHYKEDQLSSKILVNKDPVIFEWWDKACKQAKDTDKRPIVMYKWDRSKWYMLSDRQLLIQDSKYIVIHTGNNKGYIREFNTFFDIFGGTKWV